MSDPYDSPYGRPPGDGHDPWGAPEPAPGPSPAAGPGGGEDAGPAPGPGDPVGQRMDALSKDDRFMGMIAHALSFVEGGLIGPLIVYLIKKDESPFVAFHALQSFYFGLLFLIITVGTCGIGAVVLLLPYLIYEFVALMKANDGRWYKLPIVGNWAWSRHPGPPGSEE